MLTFLLALALVAAPPPAMPASAPPSALASPTSRPAGAATEPSCCSDADPAKEALQAFASHSESLTSIALLVIGGSLLVLLQRDYVRPASRRGRSFYLLFILGWLFLARSIWHGRRAQSVYLAYVDTMHHTDAYTRLAKKAANSDLGHQLDFLERGLGVFAIWLAGYLMWWIFSAKGPRDEVDPRGAGERPDRRFVVLVLIFLLSLPSLVARPALAASACDYCLHPPWSDSHPPTPSCADQCSVRAVNLSTPDELSLLHLDAKTAGAIVAARGSTGLESLADLPTDARQHLTAALAHDPAVARYLVSAASDRRNLATSLRATRADIYRTWSANAGFASGTVVSFHSPDKLVVRLPDASERTFSTAGATIDPASRPQGWHGVKTGAGVEVHYHKTGTMDTATSIKVSPSKIAPKVKAPSQGSGGG